MDTDAKTLPLRATYQLADNLGAAAGVVLLSGTQALVRLLLMQRAIDHSAGLNTAGYVSGYRGSPLGMVDQALWKAAQRLQDSNIRFVPAINEELAATQLLGTQRVESDPAKTVDGVFGLWYGKGPGVDRAGDALKHGNAYGSSPHGGVLVVAGDDHGCVSSSMPHQSDLAFQAWHMPIVSPADVGEILSFGLYGWALSRYSGAWVGLTALSEVVESTATVDLNPIAAQCAAWRGEEAIRSVTGHVPPPDGLHYRWPDFPSLRIESRLADKLAAVAAFARVNSIDREIVQAPDAHVGIVTCGKAHHDLMEALRRLGVTPALLAEASVRIYKVGLSFPIAADRMRSFASGLEEILVIEEKAPIVETQLRELFYHQPELRRPRVIGKHDAEGRPLVSALGELRPSRLIGIVATWLAKHFAQHAVLSRLAPRVPEFCPLAFPNRASDATKRVPYFCAGCPHNTSTKVPSGSEARAGIGCHFMANWMDRETTGLIQMGGEGVDWVAQSMFSRTPHVFQNLGDGTYYHSGYLAIRQAVAAKATLTYKILYNDAVAMTGGQPVDGTLSVDAIARQVESEGVTHVAVVSDDISRHTRLRKRFPHNTSFHDRAELDDVQRHLREQRGVTVLIYEQTCASEKRRRRKAGTLPDPARRLYINEAVCEGCGDCAVQSNCVAVLPLETDLGRKRRIDQTACNKDYSCANGFCPSFVTVIGGKPRARHGLRPDAAARLQQRAHALPTPPRQAWTGPWDLLVTGIGGTGVVTVGAVIAMAAHLDGHAASVLDFMGFAQKGGTVLSFVRLADHPSRLNQARIDAQQADAVLGCDLVVAASVEVLQTMRRGRTRAVINTHCVPVASDMRNPDADIQPEVLLARIREAAGEQAVATLDAQALAEELLGNSTNANILALGHAWQSGLVPVSWAALSRAIELNGVAVERNLLALAIGRLAAADPKALEQDPDDAARREAERPIEAVFSEARAALTAYQDRAWADRFEQRLRRVLMAEQHCSGADGALPLTRQVARSLRKLMMLKDEYEVARLYTDGRFEQQLREQFEGVEGLRFHMAPPLLAHGRGGKPPRKRIYGPWMMPLLRVLAKAKALRGTPLDLFGYTKERRFERELLVQFEKRVDELIESLDAGQLPLATQIAAIPMAMRGYGHVKLANVAIARAREAELLHRLLPTRYAKPADSKAAGQLRGIEIVSG